MPQRNRQGDDDEFGYFLNQLGKVIEIGEDGMMKLAVVVVKQGKGDPNPCNDLREDRKGREPAHRAS